jgi:WD40 repeat protein
MKYAVVVCILFLPVLIFAHSFTGTGQMEFARQGHTATLLPDGNVLVAAGKNSAGTLATAELFHPLAGTFTRTGNLVKARTGHTATLLPGGKVLIAGGQNATGTLTSAEIFHPATGIFTQTGSMTQARVGHTATLLANGKVLIAGGGSATAEVFDPSTGKFIAVSNMSTSRQYAAAILLANGQVLVVGGHGFGKSLLGDLFNPATGTFRTTANKGTQASYLTSTMLQNGAVLLTGGGVPGPFCGLCAPPPVSTSSAFLFHSSTASFSTTGSMYSAYSHTATLLVGGEVLVTGGSNVRVLFCRGGCPVVRGTPLASAVLYNPSSATFISTINMTTARVMHTATMLANGRVLVVGGVDASGAVLSSSEVFQ